MIGPVTCIGMPDVDEVVENAQRLREEVALWVWNDDYYERQILIEEIIAAQTPVRRAFGTSQSKAT